MIENIEFLKLQQQYLEAKSEFFYYGEDLNGKVDWQLKMPHQ